MSEIEKLRNQIDSIDNDIVKLFEDRMDTAAKIAAYKKENNIPVLNRSRENEVIESSTQGLHNKVFSKYIKEIFTTLMKVSREYQTDLLSQDKKAQVNVGYCGVPGSYAEEALLDYFGEDTKRLGTKKFENVFIELKNNNIDYGVVPVENSSTGAIAEVYDLMNKYDFYINGEMCVKVNHHLMGIKGSSIEDIEEVYSHPQGFEQCKEFLNAYPKWKLIPYGNTAKSAMMVKEKNDKTKAVIASERAAEIYGLDIIKGFVNTSRTNTTRFAIIGKNNETNKKNDKVSIIFAAEHKAGSLYSVLKHFSHNSINMLKIESRPLSDKPWEYLFYIDFEGNINDEKVKNALNDIKADSKYFKLLGNYERHCI